MISIVSKREYNEVGLLLRKVENNNKDSDNNNENSTFQYRFRFREITATTKDNNIVGNLILTTATNITIKTSDDWGYRVNDKIRLRGSEWRITNLQKIAKISEYMTRPIYIYYLQLKGIGK